LALALTAVVLLRQRYGCMIPPGSILFFLLCVLFLVSFVELIAEVAWVCLSRARRACWRLRIITLAASLVVYATIGGIAWTVNPVPRDQEHDTSYRAILSFFWSAGFLQETGAYSNVGCGY